MIFWDENATYYGGKGALSLINSCRHHLFFIGFQSGGIIYTLIAYSVISIQALEKLDSIIDFEGNPPKMKLHRFTILKKFRQKSATITLCLSLSFMIAVLERT